MGLFAWKFRVEYYTYFYVQEFWRDKLKIDFFFIYQIEWIIMQVLVINSLRGWFRCISRFGFVQII